MLNRMRQVISLALIVALTSLGMAAQVMAQNERRVNRDEARTLVTRIDNRMAAFRKSLDATLDRSRLDGTRAEDNINQLVKDFDDSVRRLRSSLNDRQNSTEEAQDLLRRAVLIDNFMLNRRVGGDAQSNWMSLRLELDRLAQLYNFSPRWTTGTSTGGGTSTTDIRQLINRIENRTDSFKDSLDSSLDRTRVDGTRREDNINRLVTEFEEATDRLRDRYTGRDTSSTLADAQEVVNRGVRIDAFMTRFTVGGRAASEWQVIRQDLDYLARAYNITPSWGGGGGGPIGGGGGGYGGGNSANRLTGTYRLDRSRSDNVREAAERAANNVSGDRQRVVDMLMRRLESPDQVAIERNGSNVTIASTRAPQVTFEADGRDRTEVLDNGRTVTVRATLNGDQLNVTTTGSRDTDFNVNFDPIEGGNRMRITRRISSDRLNGTVEVQSTYERTSSVAQWNIYTGTYNNTGSSTPSGDFIVPNGTQLLAVLNTDLHTSRSREGDRFTMTVRSPGEYDGATIEGYVSNIDRGGRVSGRSSMTLNFESIRMRSRTYRFAGWVENARTQGGETVRVDNEGAVRENDSRTSTTVKRTAIGTAVGAIIGAIAGGGQGAAIGAAVGAGTGAGSVYIQGRDDLNMPVGTELTIRASAPR